MMASTSAGDDNTPKSTGRTEIYCVSLALAIKTEDADQFVRIYDTVPAAFDRNKVDHIKARARELSEESVEYLESYQADLRQDGLEAPLDSEAGRETVGPDINNNPLSGCGPTTAMAYVKNNLNGMVNGKDFGDTRSRKLRPSPSCNGPVSSPLSLLGSTCDDIDVTSMNKSGATWIQNSPKEVDAKIGFGLLKNNAGVSSKCLGRHGSIISANESKSLSSFDPDSSNTDQVQDDTGPCPEKALRTSLTMIGKPDKCDIKNCPSPEPISTNHVDGVNETTPFFGPHEAQQKEREVEVCTRPMAYTDTGALPFQPNYGTCDSKDSFTGSTAVAPEETTARSEGTSQKKKKKKRKKAKQGGVTAEICVDAEEVKKSADELSSQPSSPSFETEVKKVTSAACAEQSSPTALKGESLTKEKSVKHDNKNRDSKHTESSGRKKPEPNKKKPPVGDGAKKKEPSKEEASQEAPVDPENKSESEGVSESDDGSFVQWHRRTLGVDPAKVFDNKDIKLEGDNRTAMSDPGENEDNTGWNHVVKHRKSKRREKVTGYNRLPYSSKNFSMDDSSSYSYYRGTDLSLEYLRKSHSLPKEMSKYGRRKTAVSDSDEMASTTTTTTTTPSRRNSLEMSDENTIEQKTPISSYAGRVKASMVGSGHVHSPREADTYTPAADGSQGSSKPNYSIQDSKRQVIDDSKDTKDFQVEADNAGEVKSKSAHSLSEAMNLEVSPGKKFEMNFPNLTASATTTQGGSQVLNTPQQPHNKSVQYLDLEYTHNSYAGRVKRSVKESNKKPATQQSVPSEDNASGTGVSVLRKNDAVRTEASIAVPRKGGQNITNSQPLLKQGSTVSHSSLMQESQRSDIQPVNLENKAKNASSSKIVNDPDKFTNGRKTVAITSSTETAPAKSPTDHYVASNRPPLRPPMPSGVITFGDLIIGQDDEIRVVNGAALINDDSSDVGKKPLVMRKDNADLVEAGSVLPLDASNPSGGETLTLAEKGLYVSELEGSILCGMADGKISFGSADVPPEGSQGSNEPIQVAKVAAGGNGQSVPENGSHWIKVLAGTAAPSVRSPLDAARDDRDTLVVQLMSSKEVTIDLSGSWEKTSRFNLVELSEMFAEDWERTVQQNRVTPAV